MDHFKGERGRKEREGKGKDGKGQEKLEKSSLRNKFSCYGIGTRSQQPAANKTSCTVSPFELQ